MALVWLIPLHFVLMNPFASGLPLPLGIETVH